jgi:hypothetical protein
MTLSLDIFKSETDGGLLWVGTAETVEEANSRIAKMMEIAPCNYVLFNQQTQTKVVITPRDTTTGMRSQDAG